MMLFLSEVFVSVLCCVCALLESLFNGGRYFYQEKNVGFFVKFLVK